METRTKNGITIKFAENQKGKYSYRINNPEWDKQLKINGSKEISDIDYASKIIFDIIFSDSFFYQKAISELNEIQKNIRIEHYKNYGI